MIEVRDLTKTYGGITAIKSLNFSVKKGEVVGFLGPNGAGKSTTMKIITGFMAPSSGKAMVAGYDVFENPLEVKSRIGYLPEVPPVYTDMYVTDYLRYVAQLKGVEKSKIAKNIDNAIEKTNLGSVKKRLIGHLSKGFRQRVGIAQALVSDPAVLILDEPTVGLDPKQVSEIRDLIKELKGQHTIILSTHILPEVQATCERIIIIHQGQIVAQDTIEHLTERAAGAGKVFLKVRKPSELVVAALMSVPGVKQVQAMLPEQGWEINVDGSDEVIEKIANQVMQKGFGLMEIGLVKANLEDVFLQLTYNAKSNSVEHGA